jgi:uncharacterized membrane protein YphA (DoxX/SURF4 family)
MQEQKATDEITRAWWALRIFFGAVPLVAGLDKYFNLLTDWTQYVNPLLTRLVPLSPSTLMHIVGMIEIAAGVIVLTRWTRVGAYVVMAWLLSIALNLALMGKYYDVAVRDIGLAIAAFTLAQLAAKREATVPEANARLVAPASNY